MAVTLKTITLQATDLLPALADARNGVPFRELTVLVDKVRAIVPDHEEPGCMVFGAAGLTFAWPRRMSELDQLQEKLTAMRVRDNSIRALVPRMGPMSEDQTQQLRELLNDERPAVAAEKPKGAGGD